MTTVPEPCVNRFGLLFVCTGNLYRSPIAERLFAARLDPDTDGFMVASAGTQAQPGVALSGPTTCLIGELGGSDEEFAARRLTADLVASADLVLGLAREHREAAVRLHPAAMRRCFTLEEFVRLAAGAGEELGPRGVVAHAAASRGRASAVPAQGDDIEDPDGRPFEELRRCAERIDQAVRRVATILTARQKIAVSG